MTVPVVVIAARVDAVPPGMAIEPGSIPGECDGCASPCWVAPASRARLALYGGGDILCPRCFLDRYPVSDD